MSNRNATTTLTVVALILGGLLGMVAGAYIVYAWVPPNLLFTNMAPIHLAYNGTLPQYRDVYVTHVAARYQALVTNQRTQPNAIKVAQDLLGVTTGDVKPDEAIKLVRETLNVIKLENDKDGDGGWFTRADENSLQNLLNEIQKPSAIGSTTGSVSARENNLTWNRIIGLALLGALGIAIVLAMYLLYSYLNSKTTPPLPSHVAQGSNAAVEDDLPPDAEYDQPFEEDEAIERPQAGVFSKNNPANIETTQYTHPSKSSGARLPDGYSSMDDELDNIHGNLAPTGEFISPLLSPAQPAPAGRQAAGQASEPLPRAATQATNSHVTSSGATALGAPKSTRKNETFYQTFPAIDYKHGDENLDEHHNIMGAKDLILGTCGVSVIERLGAAKPAEVIALALAVFDKTSMKTTYKVLMTPMAHGDMVLRRKLSDIGQLIPVQEGETIEITTNSLIVHVKPSNLILEKSSSSAFQYFKQVALTFDAQQRTA